MKQGGDQCASKKWVERANVFDLPAKRYHIADSERGIELGNRLFHKEVGLAADFQANPDVVAQIDEFRHPP